MAMNYVNAFKFFISNDFKSQENLDADLILFVRRFKLLGMGKKDTIAGQLYIYIIIFSIVK